VQRNITIHTTPRTPAVRPSVALVMTGIVLGSLAASVAWLTVLGG